MSNAEQKPVAWRYQSAVGGWAYGKEPPIGSKYAVEPLYTSPPQRQWVGLTWEEIDECFKITPDQYLPAHIYKRIEAKLKEKNT